MVIVNGDDFGLNTMINRAIMDLADRGILSSATIMVRRDRAALDEALVYARQYAGQARFGLHLDLDHIIPFDGTGHYGAGELDVSGDMQSLVRTRGEEIKRDMAGQLSVLSAGGVEVTHVDGHHNIHLFLPVLRLLAPLLRERGIRRVRFNRRFFASERNLEEADNILHKYSIAHPADFFDYGEIMGRGIHTIDFHGSVEIMAHVALGDNSYGREDQYFSLADNPFGGHERGSFADLEA